MKSSKTATKKSAPTTGSTHVAQSLSTRHLPMEQVDLLGHLVSHVAHRLRSPMGAVNGYCDLLHASSDPEKMQSYAEKIVASVDELNRILSEMEIFRVINTASIGRSKVKEVISIVQSHFSTSEKQRIQWSGSALESEIQTDILLMQRVLAELIRNGLQMAKPVDAAVLIEWNRHSIQVSNPGNAIPANMVEDIFLPFSGTNPRKMGLGLTIAHYLCALMNCSLKLVSNSDEEGVVFEIGISALNLRRV